MDQLRAMRVFVRVAERNSFTAAAADLGLSHGMASAIVKHIETRLGVELIRRTTRRMALTDAGRTYLDRARAILDEVDALEQDVGAGASSVAGDVTVQAPVAFSRLVLAPSLAGLLERHPELRLRLLARDRLPDMIAEPIDVVLYTGSLPDSSLQARSLGRFPILTVASPDYLARAGVPRTIPDLAGHQRIDIASATTGHVLDWRFRVEGNLVLQPGTAGVVMESSEAAIAACIGGAGVTQNISYALADPLADGRLVRLLEPWTDPGPELTLIGRRQPRATARLRAVSAHLERIIRARRDRDRALIGV